jgi:putative transposase
MPSRNAVKVYEVDSFYHAYNRGVNKRKIFLDEKDYAVFLNLLKRYLDTAPSKDLKGREYTHLHGRIELLAFCLMPNHFHLLLYQSDQHAMTTLLQSVCTSYTNYFNKRHKRVGHLFQGVFKASHITSDSYCQHISRYIHLNPSRSDYRTWEFSSLSYYLGLKNAGWVQPMRILEMFNGINEYDMFVQDYEGQKVLMDELKHELAN